MARRAGIGHACAAALQAAGCGQRPRALRGAPRTPPHAVPLACTSHHLVFTGTASSASTPHPQSRAPFGRGAAAIAAQAAAALSCCRLGGARGAAAAAAMDYAAPCGGGGAQRRSRPRGRVLWSAPPPAPSSVTHQPPRRVPARTSKPRSVCPDTPLPLFPCPRPSPPARWTCPTRRRSRRCRAACAPRRRPPAATAS